MTASGDLNRAADVHTNQNATVILDGSAAALACVLDEYLGELQAGKTPDRQRVLDLHPELSPELADCLSGIEFIHHTGHATAATPSILGDFRIEHEIGRGGMGVVYAAEQVSLKRSVALKVLRFGGVADVEAIQRFQREAETLGGLEHSHIVPVHAVGCENGVYFFAMQLIDGRSLAELSVHDLDATISGTGSVKSTATANTSRASAPIDARDAAEWGRQAAMALSHAHQNGVVHRDVKPSNLILDGNGQVWLTDFGLARRTSDATFSAAGALLGTPRYMSPEQAAAAERPVDHRTDLYSLGATLYELATGQPVFDAPTPQGIITKILNAEPEAPRRVNSQLPRDLETIILKCLSREPADRYATASDLVDDLQAYLDGQPIHARRASRLEQLAAMLRRNRRQVKVAAVSVVVGMLVMIAAAIAVRSYRVSQTAHLEFTTDGTGITAEIVDEFDQPVVPSFPVPTTAPVAVPAGAWRIRLTAPGLLSETWPLEVQPGEKRQRPVRLHARWMWPPLPLSRRTDRDQVMLLPTDQQTDFLRVRKEVNSRGRDTLRLQRLEGSTGQPMWPDVFVISAESDSRSRWQLCDWEEQNLVTPAPDLDNDGIADVVWCDTTGRSSGGPVLVQSGQNGTVLWQHGDEPADGWSIEPPANLEGGLSENSGRKRRFLSVDLNSDGKAERLAFTGTERQGENGLQLTDGGTTLWERHFDDSNDLAIDSFIAGPDLDGDGCQDVFLTRTITGWLPSQNRSGPVGIAVALSGRDGHTLWECGVETQTAWPEGSPWGELQWGPPGPDGLPLLVVPIAQISGQFSHLRRILFFSTTTGRLVSQLPGVMYDPDSYSARVSTLRIADFDNDGIRDLCWQSPDGDSRRLHVARGSVPEVWRRLGAWSPVQDLDGDGIDELQNEVACQVSSGSDASLLWTRPASQTYQVPLCEPRPGGDLNHDGIPDLVRVVPTVGGLTIAAVSGSDGRQLWIAAPFGFKSKGIGGHAKLWGTHGPGLEACDLDDDGVPEILVSDGRLTVLSGQDGRLLWQRDVVEGTANVRPKLKPLTPQDLNGDGVRDLVARVKDDAGLAVHALSGKDGSVIWTAPGRHTDELIRLPWPDTISGDLDVDGSAEVVVTWTDDVSRLSILNGKTGQQRGFFPLPQKDILPPLLVDFDGDGRRTICVGLTGGQWRLVCLDADARVQHERSFEPTLEYGCTPSGTWTHADVNGDGSEELLFSGDGNLYAYRPDGDLWSWRLPHENSRIVEVRGATDERPATVVVWSGNGVYGVSGDDGRTMWKCRVRAEPNNFQSWGHVELQSGPWKIPRVVLTWQHHPDFGWCTVVRQPWPVGPDGRFVSPQAN